MEKGREGSKRCSKEVLIFRSAKISGTEAVQGLEGEELQSDYAARYNLIYLLLLFDSIRIYFISF
jgi:hypothetical protein